MNRSIYVEIDIHATMDELWRWTQTPELHAQWDLRFSEINYLPRPDPDQPQQFTYATRLGFGLRVEGTGESMGTVETAGGSRTSVLKFWSHDPKSLIREGAGFWKYVPGDDGIRFFTRYDYQTRFGWPGLLCDRLVFRPLIGWATAWSFDTLRLQVEQGIAPWLSRQRSAAYALARLALVAIWLYHGIVPKLLFTDSGELAILQASGVFHGHEHLALTACGLTEIAFALALLAAWRSRLLLHLNNVVLLVLTVGAFFSNPALLVAPFNPVSLTLAMWALAGIALVNGRDLPRARRCRRRPPLTAPAAHH